MTTNGSDVPDDDLPTESLDEDRARADDERDGVASLHDTEAESGDEEGLRDQLSLDRKAAREIGVELGRTGGTEPELD